MVFSDSHGSVPEISSYTFQVELIDPYDCNPNYDIVLDLNYLAAEENPVLVCEDFLGNVGTESTEAETGLPCCLVEYENDTNEDGVIDSNDEVTTTCLSIKEFSPRNPYEYRVIAEYEFYSDQDGSFTIAGAENGDCSFYWEMTDSFVIKHEKVSYSQA